MTAVVYEEEQIMVKYNLTNIRPELFYADTERFFMRSEDKYGLQELDIEKIDVAFSLDYEVMMIPPLFVDKGSIKFKCEDISLNTVWLVQLNETKVFFDIIISHLLL